MAVRASLLLLLSILGHASAARIQPSRSARGAQKAWKAAASLAEDKAALKTGTSNKEASEHLHASQPASLVEGSAGHRIASVSKSVYENRMGAPAQVNRAGVIGAIFVFLVVVLGCAWKLVDLSSATTEEDPKMKTKDTLKKLRTKTNDTCSPGGSMIGREQHFHDGRLVYEWAQTNEVTKIYLKTPEGLISDDLEIIITPRRLTIGRKGKPFFLNDATYDVVDVDESAWRLCSNGELQIHMTKETPCEWPSALLHDADSQ